MRRKSQRPCAGARLEEVLAQNTGLVAGPHYLLQRSVVYCKRPLFRPVALLRRLQRTRLPKFWPRDLLIAIPANRDEGKSSPTRGVHIALWVLPILAGCATTSDGGGGVKEVSPGTYSIGVSRSSSVMFGGTEGVKAAVDEAGKYCHSKGQKLVILPTKGNEVTFQCGEKIAPAQE